MFINIVGRGGNLGNDEISLWRQHRAYYLMPLAGSKPTTLQTYQAVYRLHEWIQEHV